MEGTLNTDQIENILSSQNIGRLACCNEFEPYLTPVNFAYDGKYIYCQTNAGEKLSIMRNNPNVCFEVDIILNHRSWQSVIIHGTFEELEDEDADEAWQIMSKKVFPLTTGMRIHNHQHAVDSELHDSNRLKVVMFRIQIDSVTGRFLSE